MTFLKSSENLILRSDIFAAKLIDEICEIGQRLTFEYGKGLKICNDGPLVAMEKGKCGDLVKVMVIESDNDRI